MHTSLSQYAHVIEPVRTPVIEPVSAPVIEPVRTLVIEPVRTSVIEPVRTLVIEPVCDVFVDGIEHGDGESEQYFGQVAVRVMPAVALTAGIHPVVQLKDGPERRHHHTEAGDHHRHADCVAEHGPPPCRVEGLETACHRADGQGALHRGAG